MVKGMVFRQLNLGNKSDSFGLKQGTSVITGKMASVEIIKPRAGFFSSGSVIKIETEKRLCKMLVCRAVTYF